MDKRSRIVLFSACYNATLLADLGSFK